MFLFNTEEPEFWGMELKNLPLYYCGIYRGIRFGLATGAPAAGVHENKWANALNDSKKRNDPAARKMLIGALQEKYKSAGLKASRVTYAAKNRSKIEHAQILATEAFPTLVMSRTNALKDCAGKHIVLIDDIIRTGRTVRKYALPFLLAGAKVSVLVCAKGSGYKKTTVVPPVMPKAATAKPKPVATAKAKSTSKTNVAKAPKTAKVSPKKPAKVISAPAKLTGKDLIKELKNTLTFAAPIFKGQGNSNAGFFLDRVLFNASNGVLQIVGTNGHLLYIKELLPSKKTWKAEVLNVQLWDILDAKNIGQIDDIKLVEKEIHILYEGKTTKIKTLHVNGDKLFGYPDVSGVIPIVLGEQKITVMASELVKILTPIKFIKRKGQKSNLGSTFTINYDGTASITIDTELKPLVIKPKWKLHGKALKPADNYNVHGIIQVKTKYLLAISKAFNGKELLLSINKSNNALVVQDANQRKKDTSLALVMPIMISHKA